MDGVSLFRMYLLRATYLFIVVGLGFLIWPSLLNPPEHTEHMRGVVRSLLAGVSLLALLGLRYPLQMLPLLLFELVWKSIWMIAFGIPLRLAGELDAATRQTWNDCLITIVLFLLVIPWGYVLNNYVRKPGAPWRSRSAPAAQPADLGGLRSPGV
ncbi:MAG TPA: hypothetical protein VHH32_07740 [Gemmatimonadales bacterium]|nr:hypothetical protein [Gemmatimonadales bacterium]